jgi:hypothetical protein
MSLLHEELLHAEVDSRLARAREARLKHSFESLRRWVRRSERARIGLERALALEREQSVAAPTSGSALRALPTR